MRIEILVDNQEPRIYPLDRPKIMVGNHESCDIVIGHKSISRKHIVITCRDDAYFVSDQGSTNGSYINEHRLVPGNSAEFSSFFPVRLGDNVLMTLLSDDDAQALGPVSELNTKSTSSPQEKGDSTNMISLNDLYKSSTSGLVKKRAETVTKRKNTKKPAVKKTHVSNSSMGIIGFILVAAVSYYQFFLKDDEIETAIVRSNNPIKRISEADLPKTQDIVAALKNSKCSTPAEKQLCSDLNFTPQAKWGTVVLDKTVLMVVDGAKYLTNAKAYLPAPVPVTRASLNAYKADLNLILLMFWMQENVPLQINALGSLNNLSMTVALVDDSIPESPALIVTAVFDPESLFRLRAKINEKHFLDTKKNGVSEFSYALDYLKFLPVD